MDEYENLNMRAARSVGLCGKSMANDARRKSGRTCQRWAGHSGKCASQFSKQGQRDRAEAFEIHRR
jgi:hypothetical protein